jgi:hypothetical protein
VPTTVNFLSNCLVDPGKNIRNVNDDISTTFFPPCKKTKTFLTLGFDYDTALIQPLALHHAPFFVTSNQLRMLSLFLLIIMKLLLVPLN